MSNGHCTGNVFHIRSCLCRYGRSYYAPWIRLNNKGTCKRQIGLLVRDGNNGTIDTLMASRAASHIQIATQPLLREINAYFNSKL